METMGIDQYGETYHGLGAHPRHGTRARRADSGARCVSKGVVMATKAQRAEQEEYIEKLRGAVHPGDTLTTVLRHRSASGMYRAIDVYRFRCSDEPERARANGTDRDWLSYWIAKAGIGRWDDKREAVGVGGTGMDMGFHIVSELGAVLFPDGFDCTGDRCPASDHTNGAPRVAGERHARLGWDALRQEWL